MAKTYLLENEAGDTTTDGIAIRSYGVQIWCAGDFTSITFEDNIDNNGWAKVLDTQTGDVITITDPTNQLILETVPNCGYQLRAVVVGGASVSIGVNEGSL